MQFWSCSFLLIISFPNHVCWKMVGFCACVCVHPPHPKSQVISAKCLNSPLLICCLLDFQTHCGFQSRTMTCFHQAKNQVLALKPLHGHITGIFHHFSMYCTDFSQEISYFPHNRDVVNFALKSDWIFLYILVYPPSFSTLLFFCSLSIFTSFLLPLLIDYVELN